jgi:hypothetical protein
MPSFLFFAGVVALQFVFKAHAQVAEYFSSIAVEILA